MNFLTRVLSLLIDKKDITVEPLSRVNHNWRELRVGDKVKKQCITRERREGLPAIYSEDFYYGKIVAIDDGYAEVKFKHIRYLEREMLSDLLWASDQEWKQNSSVR